MNDNTEYIIENDPKYAGGGVDFLHLAIQSILMFTNRESEV